MYQRMMSDMVKRKRGRERVVGVGRGTPMTAGIRIQSAGIKRTVCPRGGSSLVYGSQEWPHG